MSDHEQKVREFHQKGNQLISEKPTIPDEKTRILRAKLILEEALETIEAMGVDVSVTERWCDGEYVDYRFITTNKIKEGTIVFEIETDCDLVAVADGCADLKVVTTGTQLAFGIPIDETQEAVDDSNLAKFKGDYSIREDGKLIKPSDWKAPDLEKILIEKGWDKNG